MKNSGSIFTAKQTNNLIDKKLTKNDELEPLATFLSHKNQKGSRWENVPPNKCLSILVHEVIIDCVTF